MPRLQMGSFGHFQLKGVKSICLFVTGAILLPAFNCRLKCFNHLLGYKRAGFRQTSRN